MNRLVVSSLVVALAAGSAFAQDKKKKKSDAKVDALFGDTGPSKPSAMDDLKKATDGMSASGKTDQGIAPKANVVDENAPIQVIKAFAAAKIVSDPKLGCQPAGRPGSQEKQKLVEFLYDEVPVKGPAFEVCVTLNSKAGREVRMSVAVVDPRGAKIAKAEDVVSFANAQRLDHVLEFPAVTFKNAGQHFYVVDIEGKEAGRVPLFMVKTSGESAPQAAGQPITSVP